MNLSYALGDDANLRHRLMIKIGVPLTASAAVGNNHTPETPSPDALERITSDIYRAAQGSDASRATGETGAL